MAERRPRSDSEKVEIQFRDQHDFGVFCVQLRNDNVPCGLLGFHALEMYRTDFEQMPEGSRQMYEEYLAEEKIIPPDIQIPTATGRCQMLSIQEAETLAQRLSEKY